MRKKALRKEFLMSVRKTKNRFISICLIVALGTAFYAGIRAANPDMQQSADAFFDESRLMDIRVMSTLGLTDDDVAAIEAVDGVEAAEPIYSADVLTTKDEKQLVLKLQSVPEKVNLITVDEGRLPEKENECLMDNLLMDEYGYQIGDTVTVFSGDDTAIEDTVSNDTFTIVGRGRTAYYLNLTRDSSTIGNGSMSGFLVIPKSDFNMEAYTEIGVRVKGAEELDSYGDDYKNLVDGVVTQIEAISDARCEARYEDLVSEAEREISDAEKEVSDGRKELEDAKAELEDGQAQLEDGKKTVADNERTLNDNERLLADKEKELEDGAAQLAAGWQAYETGLSQVKSGENTLNASEALLNEKEKELEDGAAQLAAGIQQLESAQAEIDKNRQLLETMRSELEKNKSELESAQNTKADLTGKLADIADGRKKLEDKKTEIADGKQALEQAEQEFEQQKAAWEQTKPGLEAEQAKIQTEMDSLEPRLDSLKSELDSCQSQMNSLTEEINSVSSEITGKKSELDSLAAAISQETDEDRKAELQKKYNEVESSLKELLTRQTELKSQYDTVVGQYDAVKRQYDEIEAQKSDLQNQYNGIAQKISATEQTLEAAEKEISGKEAELNDGEAEAARQEQLLAESEKKIQEALKQFPKDEEIEDNLKLIETGLKDAEAKAAELEAGQQALDKEKAEADIDGRKAQIEAGRRQIADGRSEIEAGRNAMSKSYAQLEAAKKTLVSSQSQIASGRSQIAEAKQQLGEAQKAIEEAKAEIEENAKKLKDAQEEYSEAEKENLPKLEDAEQEIVDAKAALKDIKQPEWYVLDREYIQTCVEYAQDAERIGAIGEVFPVIFFLVAALVSLTTMTRMVEEERTQIGTLKALGYSKIHIAGKYILYAFTATLIGGVFGTIFGQKLLPYVIMNAYGIVYVTLTEFVTPLHFGFTMTSILVAVISTTVAVIAACYKELRSVPAQLMRPEAPKAGKRVLLEKIPFIWKHLSFSNKSTIRNLFRYKKRFFMTVIGIGGCMGLLLVGFGVEDSIMTIGDKQFNEIRIYDGNITLADDADETQRQAVYDEIKNEDNVESVMFAHEETVDVSEDDKGKGARSTYLFVPSELERMPEFINLRDRKSHETYTLDDSGAVISEKLAKLLGVSEGDEVYIEVEDMKRVPVKISHIVENYFFHYIYLSPDTYEQVYGKAPEYKEIFMKDKEDSEQFEEDFSSRYLENDHVAGVEFIRSTSDRIREMIGSMDVIIYVIIVSAGLLAFVVLYNLNNINISERKRELATLKVLGFYDMEVSKYVFRENILLTFFGAIFGIFLGIVLHRYVILTAEIDMMMFGRNIYFKSYVYSILLTFAFSLIVNAVTHWKLKKIDMIESLKSVE